MNLVANVQLCKQRINTTVCGDKQMFKDISYLRKFAIMLNSYFKLSFDELNSFIQLTVLMEFEAK